MIQDNTLAVRRRQAIGLAGAVLGAAAGAVPATASAQYGMAGKSFNGAWPFDLPPTGHYNSYATGNLNLGIYYDRPRKSMQTFEVGVLPTSILIDAEGRALGRLEGAGRLFDVLGTAAGQRGDHRTTDFERHLTGGLGVSRRGNGETGLDNVHAEGIERPRHAELRGHIHRESGCLFAVAQRGVENDNSGGIVAHKSLL